MPNPDDKFQDPLVLSFSPQARLGELATQSVRIRKRMRMGEGTPSIAFAELSSSVLSPLGERDRVRGSWEAFNRI
jgi:hypothetical protein